MFSRRQDFTRVVFWKANKGSKRVQKRLYWWNRSWNRSEGCKWGGPTGWRSWWTQSTVGSHRTKGSSWPKGWWRYWLWQGTSKSRPEAEYGGGQDIKKPRGPGARRMAPELNQGKKEELNQGCCSSTCPPSLSPPRWPHPGSISPHLPGPLSYLSSNIAVSVQETAATCQALTWTSYLQFIPSKLSTPSSASQRDKGTCWESQMWGGTCFHRTGPIFAGILGCVQCQLI